MPNTQAVPNTWRSHPDDDRLERYATGQLCGEALATMEKHLLLCERCCERISQFDDFLTALRQETDMMRVASPTAHAGFAARYPPEAEES